jgi:hypothetical protein
MKLLKHFKKIVVGMLATGSTMVLAACYGVTDYRKIADGHVNDNLGNPIPIIEVCISSSSACTWTDVNGYYDFEGEESNVYQLENNGFQICVEDKSDLNDGEFLKECTDIQPGPLPIEVDFDMDLAKK